MVRTDQLIGLAATRLRYLGKISSVIIDNWAFSLHYRFATISLMLLSLFVTCNQFFGDPIACIKTSDVDIRIINGYCWVEGTFTLPKALLRQIEIEANNYTSLFVASGIDKTVPEKDEKLAQNYYYWVSLVLFLQACSFLIPRILWKIWEGGQMKFLIKDMNKCILTEDAKKTNADKIVEFIKLRFGYYDRYAFKFMICEAINLAHVLFEIYLTNKFLQGEFLMYGYNMLTSNQYDISPTGRVFPKLAKCTFNRFGPSGDIQAYDNLCLLPLNILNEKIYFFVWLLFAFLLITSTCALLYRIAVITINPFRGFLLRAYNRSVDKRLFAIILDHCSYGDWFLLYLLSRNIDQMYYNDIVALLAHRLGHQLPYDYSQSIETTLRQR